MATEKESTKSAPKKKDSTAESSEKKTARKPRTAKPKETKAATSKTKSTKAKSTKTAKSAAKTATPRKRSTTKAAKSVKSTPKTAQPKETVVVEPSVDKTSPAINAEAQAPAPTAEPTTAMDAEAQIQPVPDKPAPPPSEPVKPAPAEDIASAKAEASPPQSQKPEPSYITPPSESSRNVSMLLYAGLGFVIIISLIVFASLYNMGHYYLKHTDGALEIWQGKFSPMGMKRLLIMPGVQSPETIKDVYTRQEVYPIAFDYYIDKADALLEVSGLPDFAGIKSDLNRALSYALSEEQRQIARSRLDRIEMTVLLYRADVAVGRGTPASLNLAQKHLGQAAQLNPDEIEAQLIQQKLESIDALMAALAQESASTDLDEPASDVPVESPAAPLETSAHEGVQAETADDAESPAEPTESQ